jgi:hypothetical protein
MKIKPVGTNQTEVELKGGTIILYSYKTPVAAFVPGRGALCSMTKYSRTTSKHVTLAMARWDETTRIEVDQSIIDQMADR